MMEHQYENYSQPVHVTCGNTNVNEAEERPGSPFEHRRHRVRLSASGNTFKLNGMSEQNAIECTNNNNSAMPHNLPCIKSKDVERETNHHHSVFDQVANNSNNTVEHSYDHSNNNDNNSMSEQSNNNNQTYDSTSAAVIQNVELDELYNKSFDVMQLGNKVNTEVHETLLHPCVNFSDDEISFTLETPADDEVEVEVDTLAKVRMCNEDEVLTEHCSNNNNNNNLNESNEGKANVDELRTSPMPFTLLNAEHDLRRKRIKKVSHYILGPLLGEGMGGVVRDGIDIAGENGGFHRCAVKIVTIPRRWVASPMVNLTEQSCNMPERGRRGLMSLEEKRYAIFRNELNNLQRFHNKHLLRATDVFTRYGKEYVVIPFAVCSLEHLVKEALANPNELNTHKVSSSSKTLQNKKENKDKCIYSASSTDCKENVKGRSGNNIVEHEQPETVQELSYNRSSSSLLASSGHAIQGEENQKKELDLLSNEIEPKESTSFKSEQKCISYAERREEQQVHSNRSSSSPSSSSSASSLPEQETYQKSQREHEQHQMHKRHHRTTHTTNELSDFNFIHRAEEREEKQRQKLELQEQYKNTMSNEQSSSNNNNSNSNSNSNGSCSVSRGNNIANAGNTNAICLNNLNKGKNKLVAVHAASSDDSDRSSMNSSSSSTRTIDSYCRSSAIVSKNAQNGGSNHENNNTNVKKNNNKKKKELWECKDNKNYQNKSNKVEQRRNVLQNSYHEPKTNHHKLSSSLTSSSLSSSLHLEVISSPVTASTSLISCSDTQSNEFASLTKTSTHDSNTKNSLLNTDLCYRKDICTQRNCTESITSNANNVMAGINNNNNSNNKKTNNIINNNSDESQVISHKGIESSRSTQLLIPEKTREFYHDSHVHSTDLRGSLFRSHSMCTTPISSMEETSMLESVSLNSLPQVDYHRPHPHPHHNSHTRVYSQTPSAVQEKNKEDTALIPEQIHNNNNNNNKQQPEKSTLHRKKQSSKRRAILSPTLIKSIMYQLLFGVAYLHRQCLAHNDIKPSNVLIFEDGTVVLSDLGSVGQSYNDEGTPLYAAPELCRYFYGAYDDEVENLSEQQNQSNANGPSHQLGKNDNVHKMTKDSYSSRNKKDVHLRECETNNESAMQHESFSRTSFDELQQEQQQQQQQQEQQPQEQQQHEIITNESSMKIDARKCDMWCCGLVLYYLITGQVGPLSVQRQCLHTELTSTINANDGNMKNEYAIHQEEDDEREHNVFNKHLPPHSRFQLYRAIAHDAHCFTLNDIPPLPCNMSHSCTSNKLFRSQSDETSSSNILRQGDELNKNGNSASEKQQQEQEQESSVHIGATKQENINICSNTSNCYSTNSMCEQNENYKSKRNEIKRRNNEMPLKTIKENSYPTHTVQHLLSCLLESDPNKRITAEDALQHPWLAIYLKARRHRKIRARALRGNERNSTSSTNRAKQSNHGILFYNSQPIHDNNGKKDNDEDTIYCTRDVQVNEANIRSPTSPLMQHGCTYESASLFSPNYVQESNSVEHKEELRMEQKLEKCEELTNTANTPSREQSQSQKEREWQKTPQAQNTVDTFSDELTTHKNVNGNTCDSNENIQRKSANSMNESNEKDASRVMAFSEVVKVQAAIDEAISRDVAQRVLHAPLFKRILHNDRLNHLQFVADCCNTLHIPLPPEIIQAPSAEPYGPEEYYCPHIMPTQHASQKTENLQESNVALTCDKLKKPLGKKNKIQHKENVEHRSWYGSDVHDAYGYNVCTASYTLPSVMPAGCVDPELFLPYEEANYYESKGGKAEFDVCRLQVQPMKVMQLEEYLHNVVMVQCGYRTCADPMFTVAAAAIFAATANNNNSYFGLSQRVKRKAVMDGDNSTVNAPATNVVVINNNTSTKNNKKNNNTLGSPSSSSSSSFSARERLLYSTPAEGVILKSNLHRGSILPVESQSTMQVACNKNNTHYVSEVEQVNREDNSNAKFAECADKSQRQSVDACTSKNSDSSENNNVSSKKYNKRQTEKKSGFTTFMQRFKSSKKTHNSVKLADDEETKSVQSNLGSKSNDNKNIINAAVDINNAKLCVSTPANNMQYKHNASSSSMSTNSIASECSSEQNFAKQNKIDAVSDIHEVGVNQSEQIKQVIPLSALAQSNNAFNNINYNRDSRSSETRNVGNVEEKRRGRAGQNSVLQFNGNHDVSVTSNENSVASRSNHSSIRNSMQQRRQFRSDYSACSTDDTITVDSRDDHVVMRESSKCLCGLM